MSEKQWRALYWLGSVIVAAIVGGMVVYVFQPCWDKGICPVLW